MAIFVGAVTSESNVTFLGLRNAEKIESCNYRISIKCVLVFLRVYEYQQITAMVMYYHFSVNNKKRHLNRRNKLQMNLDFFDQ